MTTGRLVPDAEAIGRPGDDLKSVVWPTPEIRFVTVQRYHPFSGPAQLVVRAVGPEIRERPNAKILVPIGRLKPYSAEVVFAQNEEGVASAELMANKMLIVLAAANVESEQMTREAFYARACDLFRHDLYRGVRAGRAVVHSRENVVELKDRARVPRKSF